MDNNASFVDLLYEIAPESRYWSNIVSDLEQIVLSNIPQSSTEGNEITRNELFDCDEISPAHRETLSAILPHLQRVLSIQKKMLHLEQQRDLAVSLLETMPVGIVVVDADSKVISLNRVAKRLCGKSRLVCIESGHLFVKGNSLAVFLNEANPERNLSREESIHNMLDSDSEQLSLLVTNSKLENHFIAFLSDERGREYISHSSLQQLFPISHTEADLCVHLVQGLSLEAIADKRQTSVQTIRTQFKSVFRKTRTNGQVQLVRKILTSLARISTEDYFIPETDCTASLADNDKSRLITLSDGRKMAYEEYGDPSGYPVVFCHSLFGSRYEYPATDELPRCRVIIPDRPGYGLSDANPDSNYVTWVKDLEELLDHLGIQTFAIAGLSSGAIYALAVASLMNDRVSHVSSMSIPPRISSWKDLQYVSLNLKFFNGCAMLMPALARILFEKEVMRLRSNTSQLIDRITEDKADEELLMSEPVFSIVEKNYSESLKGDISHVSNEVFIHAQDWGFSMKDILCPVDFWCGELDKLAPLNLVEKTIAEVENKTIHTVLNKAHFFYYELWSKILQNVMQRKLTLITEEPSLAKI